LADAPQRSRDSKKRWGKPPWIIDFHPLPRLLPEQVDFAIIGGGFTGLATAAWLRHLAPEKSVGVGRRNGRKDSRLSWSDSGTLRVVSEIPGGTADPGKLVSGLARAAHRLGAHIYEDTRIDEIDYQSRLRLKFGTKTIFAENALIATNAMSLELSGLAGRAEPKFTLAVATEPLKPAVLEVLGLDLGKAFYTVDLPYLWGRMLPDGGVLFGGGLVDVKNWSELDDIDIGDGRAAELIASLEKRVRGLDPVLRSVGFTHWWGGPILIADDWSPIFARHPRSDRVIVLGAYAGQGVALSVYLGRWAAEAMLGRRQLPNWG
jgi:glycine/D-amino acid oxidase-like deaminating enzyme